MEAEIIRRYFPNISDHQFRQFQQLKELYLDWNSKINVISRKDTDDFYIHHVVHSLGIAKIMVFANGSEVLDIGTGGGFPGIPLAILFPEVQFHLVDSIGKKIKVVQGVAEALDLKNIRATHARAEEIKEQYDFVVSRAVTAMPQFIPWTKGKFLKRSINPLRNGILYLKGGDLSEELAPLRHPYIVHPLKDFFEEDFFETKAVVYVKINT